MNTLGSFTLIKNEIAFIRGHLEMWLPILDQMVFYDGNSTDGTLEVLRELKANHQYGHKIKLFEDKDPKNLQEDYSRLFNECMWQLDTDFSFFCHPDFLPVVGTLPLLGEGLAYTTKMESFAGEPGGQLLKLVGRSSRWKNIYRLRNPNLGAHYHGTYGHHSEDVYFSEITGNQYEHHGQEFQCYPYVVKPSGLEILHLSDVRTYARRLERMISCMENQGHNFTPEQRLEKAKNHPRVALKDGSGFVFKPVEHDRTLDLFHKLNSGVPA